MLLFIISVSVIILAAAALAVFHKKMRRVWVSVTACLAAVLLAGTGISKSGYDLFGSNVELYYNVNNSVLENGSDSYSENGEGYLDIIRYLLSINRPDYAEQVLSEYSKFAEYSPEYLNISAMVFERTGNAEKAEMMRKALEGTSFESESYDISDKKINSSSKLAARAFYSACMLAEKETGSYDNYYADSYQSNDYDEYDDDDDYGYDDDGDDKRKNKNKKEKDITDPVKELSDWMEAGSPYINIPCMSKTLLAAELYLNNYTEIADRVMNKPDGNSLIIASQLVRTGRINDEDIERSEYQINMKKDAKNVRNLISKALSDKSYSDAQIKLLNEKRDSLDELLNEEDDVLSKYIIHAMEENAAIGDEASAKVFLELADIAYANGDEAAGSKYVERSLSRASLSNDPEFSAAVAKINDVVQNADSPEARKKLSEYIDIMTANRMPVGLPDINSLPESSGKNKNKDKDKYTDDDDYDDSSYDDYDDYDDDDIVDNKNKNKKKYDDSNSRNDIFADNFEYDSNLPDDSSKNNIKPLSYQTNYTAELDEDDPDSNAEEAPDSTGLNGSENKSLSQNINDSVNKLAGVMGISYIDTSKFPQISAVASIDENYVKTADDFKEHMEVVDTGAVIEDYQVEKIDFNGMNIMLVCDDSGSMGGTKSQNLSEAVQQFVTHSDPDVNIGMLAFADYIKQDTVRPIGASQQELVSAAQTLHGSGGTNIYDAAIAGAEKFKDNDYDKLNIMIIMSDGQDEEPSPEKFSALKEICTKKGITIYTMGLGTDVDADVLSSYSNECEGQYFYIDDPTSILTFYSYIYNLSKNRFKIDFTAIDTFNNDRLLELTYDQSSKLKCSQSYTIYDLSDSNFVYNENQKYKVVLGSVIINGFKEKLIYYSKSPQTVTLMGKGFKKDKKMAVELKCADTYVCEVKYKSETEAEVTVPANVPAGVYNVFVTYDKWKKVIPNGFIIAEGDRKMRKFGPYVFSASSVKEADNTITMSGIVSLNDWLYFTDPITLKGNIATDSSITMDFGNTSMHYEDPNEKGLGGYYARNGLTSSLGTKGTVTLYNDTSASPDSDNYRVDTMPLYDYNIIELMAFNSANVSIYPNKAVVNFDEFILAPSFLTKIIKKTAKSTKGVLPPFTMDASHKITYKKNTIDCKVTFDTENAQKHKRVNRNNSKFKLGNITLSYYGDFTLTIDTESGVFSLGMGIDNDIFRLTAKPGETEQHSVKQKADIGAEVGTKNWKLDFIKIKADFEFPVPPAPPVQAGPVPLTFDNFEMKIEDLSQINNWYEIFNRPVEGKCDISAGKLSAVCPPLKKVFGDVSVVKFANTYLNFSLKDFRIKVGTTAKLLEKLEIGSVEGQIGGNLEYGNPLVNCANKDGFILQTNIGPKVDLESIDFTLNGSANLAILKDTIGLWGKGEFDLALKMQVLFIELKKDIYANGDIFLGWERQHNDKMAFLITGRGSATKGKNNNFRFVIGENDSVATQVY